MEFVRQSTSWAFAHARNGSSVPAQFCLDNNRPLPCVFGVVDRPCHAPWPRLELAARSRNSKLGTLGALQYWAG